MANKPKDHLDAWNVANYKKDASNMARCYIDAIGLIWAMHGKGCICVFCVVPASETTQSKMVQQERCSKCDGYGFLAGRQCPRCLGRGGPPSIKDAERSTSAKESAS